MESTYTYVKSVRAEGVYGFFDIDQVFEKGLNVIYGKNGAGKTTVLHILANALNGDFERFKHLRFKNIRIELSDERILEITNERQGNKSDVIVKLNNITIFPEFQPSVDSLKVILKRIPNITDEDLLTITEILLSANDRSEQRIFLKNLLSSDLEDLNPYEENQLSNSIFSWWDNQNKTSGFSVPAAYLPAFRTMIEAWGSTYLGKASPDTALPLGKTSIDWKAKATEQARSWFGAFIPNMNFPSLFEIEEALTRDIFQASISVGNNDRDLLTQAFYKIFLAISNTQKDQKEQKENTLTREQLLIKITRLLFQLERAPMGISIYKKLHDEFFKIRDTNFETQEKELAILDIYREVFEESLKEQTLAFDGIEKYINSINKFFRDDQRNIKQLAINLDDTLNSQQWIGVSFSEPNKSPREWSFIPGLGTLSSGERQIITLIYASTHMSQQNVILIDEPEISLHVDWQRKLISEMVKHIGDRQIITCTHSPMMCANYPNEQIEFSFKRTQLKSDQIPEAAEN